MRNIKLIKTVVLHLTFFVLQHSLMAQSGSLDLSFDTDGIVTTLISFSGNKAYAVTTQADGKIVTAGESSNGNQLFFTVTRYNADGSLDNTFDNNGIVTTQIGTNDFARGVAIQPDGKIVVAGYSIVATQFVFALARYNTNGSLDNSFGNNGIVITALGSGDYGRAVAIQADGKIIVVGSSAERFVVIRYNSNGSLDVSFGNNGIVITTVGTYDQGHAAAIQTDGKILAGGYTEIGNQLVFTVLRYNTNGSLDASFGNNGIATASIGQSDDRAYGMVLQPDGKIVLAGYSLESNFLPVFALARFNPNGSLDASFDNNGIVTTNIEITCQALAVVLQPDGKIVAVGYALNDSINVFALARYNTNGTLDNSFDTDGIVTTAINDGCQANAVTLQTDGKIVVAGLSYNNAQIVYTLARYNDCASATFSQSLTICAGQSVGVGNNTYTTSGTYSDTLTAVNSCDSIVTTILTVNPMPILTTYLMGTIIISNQNGATYQWISCNNNNLPIAGETNQSFTATVNGSYAVIVTSGSCSDTSACVNIFNVGLPQFSDEVGQLSIYPNPFSSSTTIQTNQVLKNATLRVYNSLGEQLSEVENINESEIIFPRDNLANGFYFIQLTQDNRILAKDKLVIVD
jgi:uncharacterized delta-60 repeat protein